MSPLAHLLLAAAVLHAACPAAVPAPAPALSIQPVAPADADITAQLQDVDIEEQIPALKDENKLRNKPDVIPVAVLIEDSQPAIKTNEVADDDEEIKRPAVDLRNPGPPQRQEHETQNSDHFPDAKEKLASVRDTILQTRDLLQQGIQGVGNDISNWLATNQQMNQIQQNIQSLRESFTLQIQKLNEAAKELAAPQALKTEETPEETKPRPDIKIVEKQIKNLENHFNNGVRALSEGVNIVAILRAEDESVAAEPAPAPAVPAPAAPTETTDRPPGQNILFDYISNLQHTLSDSIRNMTNAFANNFNPTNTVPPGVQADTPAGSAPASPNPWQLPNWQLPNLGNLFGGQAQSEQNQEQGTVPFVSGIQTVWQNVIGYVRPKPPSNAAPAGSHTDPQKPEVPIATYNDAEAAPAPAAAAPAPAAAAPAPAAAAAPLGPIQQILTNNPVVQSITNTVQRIQSSITNPEKPRDPEKTKGGYGKPGSGSGSSDDSGSGVSQQAPLPVKDAILEEPKKPVEETISPEVVEKTE